MRPLFTMCLFALALAQRQCNMASPDAIKQKVEEALQPYFANAKGEVVPRQGAIVGLTCLSGVGSQFPAKIMNAMAVDQDIVGQLNMMKLAPFVGGASYRYFILGFDNGMIRYDVQTRQFATLPPTEGYVEHYRQMCGFVTVSQQQ